MLKKAGQPGTTEMHRAAPRVPKNPQAKFLTCGKDRFFMFPAAPDGCKIKINSIDAMTRFILNNTFAACGFGFIE